MSGFNTEDGMVTKAEAQAKITGMAKDQGIKGAFKVFYDNNLVSTPDDLPESVSMDKVRVSAVLDQAV